MSWLVWGTGGNGGRCLNSGLLGKLKSLRSAEMCRMTTWCFRLWEFLPWFDQRLRKGTCGPSQWRGSGRTICKAQGEAKVEAKGTSRVAAQWPWAAHMSSGSLGFSICKNVKFFSNNQWNDSQALSFPPTRLDRVTNTFHPRLSSIRCVLGTAISRWTGQSSYLGRKFCQVGKQWGKLCRVNAGIAG